MIRIIVKVADATHAVNAGSGSVIQTFRTFDIEAPDLEALLRRRDATRPHNLPDRDPIDAWVVGAEVLK